MIRRLPLRAVATVFLALMGFVADARAAVIAAGAADGAWLVTDSAIGGAPLIFIDPERPGVGLTVARFSAAPIALGAGDACVVAAFAPESVEAQAIRPMRLVEIETGPSGLQVFTRPRALPPLPTGAPLAGLAVVGTKVVALTISPQALWICDGSAWTSTPLPDTTAPIESMWVVDYLGRIGLCDVDTTGRGALWTADPPPHGQPWSWTRADIAIPPDARAVIRVSSHLVSAHLATDTGSLVLSLLRPEEPIERARIETTGGGGGGGGVAPAESAIAPFGDRILVASPGKTDPLRIDIRVVGLDGQNAFTGPLKSASPLSTEDVQLVVFGVMGVVLAAMLFALRTDTQGVIRLPEGTVLAPPRRRIWATLIDLVPGIAAGWAVGSWQLAAGEYADPVLIGIAAGFIAALIPAVIGEATTGRTIGKALLGLRTVGAEGTKPTWPQALGRNLSKLLYPPLGLLILLNPAATTPGSCGTIVVMNRPPPDPGAASDPGPPTPGR